jgi:hypothetical protein
MITFASVTVPCGEKADFSPSSRVDHASLVTKSLCCCAGGFPPPLLLLASASGALLSLDANSIARKSLWLFAAMFFRWDAVSVPQRTRATCGVVG